MTIIWRYARGSFRIALLSVLLILMLSGTCCGEDYDFVIRNYDVHAVINPDRSYDITETLDVHFDKALHGIKREIFTESSAEKEIILTNIAVDGDPFVFDGENTIRIGDEDKKVKGEKRYVIHYTLKQFADEDDTMDFVYLNLIGTANTVPVEKVRASVTLPPNAVINESSLYSGYVGSRTNALAEQEISGETITVTNLRELDPEEGITILVKMNKGVFPDAPKWTPALIFENVDAAFTMDDYGRMYVSERFDVSVSREAIFSMGLIDGNAKFFSRLHDVTLTLPDGKSISEDNEIRIDFSPYIGKRVILKLEYDRDFLVGINSEPFIMNQLLLPEIKKYLLKDMTVKLNFPFSVSAMKINRNTQDNDFAEIDEFDVRFNGLTGTAKNDGTLAAMRSVWLQADMDAPAFNHTRSFSEILVLLTCLTGVGFSVWLSFSKRQRLLNPVPEFEPPAGLNPIETSYIYSSSLYNWKMGSMIFYWASKGCLSIEIKNQKDFILYKKKKPNAPDAPYEGPLYNGLWSEKEDAVSERDLRHFSEYVTAADKAVREKYSDDRALIDKKREWQSRLIKWGFTLLYSLLMVLSFIPRGALHFPQSACLFVAMVHCWLISMIVNGCWNINAQNTGKVRKSFGVLAILYLGFTAWLANVGYVAGTLFTKAESIFITVSLLMVFLLVPLIRRRTAFGMDLLEKVLGFRQFMMVAEKDRLEMLLASNPEYYYDTLPYAQTLNVSKIWEKKFQGITMSDPSWAMNYAGTLPLFHSVNSMSGNMIRSANSSHSGGGGSSGGGSGGGGVSGW